MNLRPAVKCRRMSFDPAIAAMATVDERCAICGCKLHRRAGSYARPTTEGRSHATAHHFVAERFFGRSANRRGTTTDSVFTSCPWGVEGKSEIFCYECHEELLHNPVLLPDAVAAFATLVQLRGLAESDKPLSREKIAGRIKLLQEVIARGISAVAADSNT